MYILLSSSGYSFEKDISGFSFSCCLFMIVAPQGPVLNPLSDLSVNFVLECLRALQTSPRGYLIVSQYQLIQNDFDPVLLNKIPVNKLMSDNVSNLLLPSLAPFFVLCLISLLAASSDEIRNVLCTCFLL